MCRPLFRSIPSSYISLYKCCAQRQEQRVSVKGVQGQYAQKNNMCGAVGNALPMYTRRARWDLGTAAARNVYVSMHSGRSALHVANNTRGQAPPQFFYDHHTPYTNDTRPLI